MELQDAWRSHQERQDIAIKALRDSGVAAFLTILAKFDMTESQIPGNVLRMISLLFAGAGTLSLGLALREHKNFLILERKWKQRNRT